MSEPKKTAVKEQVAAPEVVVAGQQAVATRSPYEAFVDRMTTQVVAALPISVPDADLKRARARFRVAFSADAQRALQDCSPESVARAIVLSAMSGLFPGGPRPDVWLIPRRNKHKNNALECNWQMAYRGYIRLARRAGWELEPVLVFEGERFKIREGDNPGVEHERDLDMPATWETLRYGYIRIFPTGQRAQARIAYLNKAEIQKRRNKAQDQSIWNEWPLEMALKTLCNYAGNREYFPTDDPARYAMEASEQAEIGGGSPVLELTAPEPHGARSAALAARLKAQVIPAAEQTMQEAARDQLAEAEGNPALLSSDTIADLRDLARLAGASMSEIEADLFGGPLEEQAASSEAMVVAEIERRKEGA